MPDQEPEAMTPPWTRELVIALVWVLVVLFIVVLFLDDDYRGRVVAASESVGVFATLGAVFVAYLALRQLELQRKALEQQRESSEAAIVEQRRALELQRSTSDAAIVEQQKALREQRRSFELGRLAELRRDYARLLGGSHDVLTGRILNANDRLPTTSLFKIFVELQLHDRDTVRGDIASQMYEAVTLNEDDQTAIVMLVRDRVARLSEIARTLHQRLRPGGPAFGLVPEAATLRLLRASDAEARTIAARMTPVEILLLRRDAIGYGRRALTDSFAFEESMADPK